MIIDDLIELTKAYNWPETTHIELTKTEVLKLIQEWKDDRDKRPGFLG